MILRFSDKYVWVNNRCCRQILAAEGQSYHCRIEGETRFEGTLQVSDGNLTVDGLPIESGASAAGLAVERWGDVWQVRAAVREAQGIVEQQRHETGGTVHTVTAVGMEGATYVWWDSADTSRLRLLPAGQAVQIAFSDALSAALVAVRRGGEHYVLCWSLLDGDVLYAGCCREYSLNDDLLVVCTYADMRNHIRTAHYGYRNAEFCMYAQSFTCANEHVYISQLTPYLFAEALAVGDADEARGYLTQTLQQEYAALLDYIGVVAAVRCPPVASAICDVGILDDKGQGHIFRFDMDGAQICDVRRLD